MAKNGCVKWMRYLCFFFIFAIVNAIFSPSLPAQRQEGTTFERITIEQGLSQNTVLAVLQDSRGFIWLGTEDGLNRFDGYTFKVYRHDPDDPGSLSNNFIRAIYEDTPGTIWIGTQGGGINRFDPKTGSFTRYTYKPSTPNCLSNNVVWTIRGGPPGVVWIGTDNGLNRFDCKTETFTRWFHQEDNPNSLSNGKVKSICKDGTGGLWIGTLEGGLNRLVFNNPETPDKKEGTFTHYRHHPDIPGSLSHDKVYTVFVDSAGVLWVGTLNGLDKFDSRNGIFTNYAKKYSDRFNPNGHINVLTGGDGGDASILWIGTYGGGLYRFEGKKEMFTRYKYNPGRPGSLSNNRIQSIYIDTTGILWVGTDSGLNTLDKKKNKFGHWEMEPDRSNSISNNNIFSVYKDGEGIIWLGTEGGLRRFDRENNKCAPTKIDGSEMDKKIQAIHEDSTGILWLGTSESGLYQIHREKGTFVHYKHVPANPGSLSDNRINVIHKDTTGILWIGTRTGLNRFKPETGTFKCYRHLPGNAGSLSDDYVSVIHEDHSGVLWIGTANGLNRFHRKSDTFTHWKRNPGDRESLSNDSITAILEDKNGGLWIGTMGGGLNKFDKNGTFKHYLERDGLPNDSISGILEDAEGDLWISTNKGVSKFDSKQETFKNYDVKDGLQSNEFNGGTCYKSADGEMFFGGINGFNAFYPNEIEDNPHVPPIVITAFQIMNESVEIGGDSPLKQAINETKEITLSYRDYFFSFEFAALDFTNPAKNMYAFKMEGLDEEWIRTGAKRRFVTYTNLDPGEYVFRVKGSNNHGVWNNEGTSIKIIITPPLWKTLWFRILAIISFAVFSYWLIGFIKKYVALAGFWKKEKYIGKFKLVGKIGSGGMGTIYRAKDTTQKIGTVALKVLKDELYIDENYRKRFKQEAAIIDQLDHPNIVKVIERGQFEQKLFIAMELLRGQTLSTKIAQEDEIDLMEVIDIIYQVTDALVKIHSKYIVHRDLKPDNIMLIEHKGNCNFVKLLDFGLAKTEHQTRITQTGTVLGTLNYMAPEQIADGRFSYASDVYSLGVIFYETLTKAVPFPGDNVTDIMRQILNDAPAEPILRRPDLTPGLNSLVLRMIEKHPGSRPLAKEVFDEIKGFRLVQTQYINED